MNKRLLLRILLAIWFFCILLIVWGWAVLHSSGGGTKLGKWGPRIIWLSKLPSETLVLLKGINTLNGRLISQKVNTDRGNNLYREDSGYLLISYFNKSLKTPSVKLKRLKDTVTIFQWNINIKEINKKIRNKYLKIENNRVFTQPYLDNEGNLFLSNPFLMIKKDGTIEILSEAEYHHSMEIDYDGNFWLPGINKFNNSFKKIIADEYEDNLIVKLSKKGKVLFKRSVTEILIQNGFRGLVWGTNTDVVNPIHLNDIQPTSTDSDYWKKGDIFVSLRSLSTVFLYRPSTDKILWLKTGPWLSQHDVHIINNHQISIFGNDIIRSTGKLINIRNEVYVYDFKEETVSTPYSNFLNKSQPRTITEGRQKIIENGDLFIEDTNNGRLLRGSKSDVLWEYVERQDENHISYLGWCRYYTKNKFIEELEKINVY